MLLFSGELSHLAQDWLGSRPAGNDAVNKVAILVPILFYDAAIALMRPELTRGIEPLTC
jgi:hypothetical protein